MAFYWELEWQIQFKTFIKCPYFCQGQYSAIGARSATVSDNRLRADGIGTIQVTTVRFQVKFVF
jgi:hypothetical protein